MVHRGVPRNLKGGGAISSRPFFAQSEVKSKKKVNTSADVQFSGSKSTEEHKKRSSRPQIVLYTYIIFTPRKFCAFVCGEGGPRPPPPWIRLWSIFYKIVNHVGYPFSLQLLHSWRHNSFQKPLWLLGNWFLVQMILIVMLLVKSKCG